MVSLPWLGLGLSTNLNAAQHPHPYRLLTREPGLFDFVEYSAPLSLDSARSEASLFAMLFERRFEVPALFHPVHLNLYGPELESAEALADLAEHARAVDSPWVGNDVGWWHHRGEPFPGFFYVSPPMTRPALDQCVRHALHVQSALPVPLLLENPAFIERKGPLHVLDFMAELQARTGAGLLLDLGHLLSHQLSVGLPVRSGLDGFPLEKVIEIHIAGGLVTTHSEAGAAGRRFYADDHTLPVREELFELLSELLPRCTALRAVTFEGDGHPDEIAARTLRRLRPLISRGGREPQAFQLNANPRPDAGDPVAEPISAASIFSDDSPTQDSLGHRVELDYRLAILAQTLDAAWPATRALIADSREAVALFARSPELLGCFSGEGGVVVEAFGRYARRVSRERRDDALAAVLSFETWARLRPSVRPAPEGEVGLGEGWTLAEFPFDFSELLFGVQTIRRHVRDRAAAAALPPSASGEGLRPLALRPGAGPWSVAVRTTPRLEVLPLSSPLARLLRRAAKNGPWDRFNADVGDDALIEGAIRGGLLRGR